MNATAVPQPRSRERGRPFAWLDDGPELPAHVDPSAFIDPGLAPVESEFPQILDAAIRSRTIGDRLDRAWAVAVLAGRRQDGRHRRDRSRVA